VFCLLQY